MITHFINIKNGFLFKPLCLIIFFAVNTITFGQSNPNSVRGVTDDETAKAIGNQYALVVGVSKYHNIQTLLYADDDAVSFKDFLIDTKLVPEANIHTLIDSTATRSRFYAEIKKIMDKLKENDRVIIYFAGHGDVDNDIDAGFLLGYNCEATPYAASDAIDISMLERYVDAITKKNVKVILISDACRSGKLTGGVHGAELTLTALSSRFKNTIKILSCGPGELSEETNFRGGGHGVFTYYLLEALYGLADEDNNNQVTKKELDKFLKDKVAHATGDRQNPIIEGNANEVILDVTPELKQAILAKTKVEGDTKSVAKRSFSQKNYTSLSSDDSMLVKKFYTQLRDGKLNTPEGDNAYEIFLAAKKNIKNDDLVNAMKYDLAAGLEDDVQPLINRFTRGEFQDYPYTLFRVANKKLKIINSELITPDDYRYNEIKTLQIFFTNAGHHGDSTLKQLLIADSILPNTAYINCEIARSYADKVIPDTASAFKYFKRTLQIAPTWPFPYLIEGLLYMDLNMNHEAIAAFEKALSLKSDFKLALINLGVVYSRFKDDEKEISYYNKALQIEKPENVIMFANLGMHYRTRGAYDSAMYYYKKGYATDPDDIFNLSGMIKCFNRINQKDSAVFYLEKLKNTNAVSYDDYKDIGDAYLDMKEFEHAIASYKKALEIKPTAYGYNNIGFAYNMMQKTDEAKKYYRLSFNLQPDFSLASKNLGILYNTNKQYDSAIYFFKKIIAGNPTDIASTNLLISAFLNAKQKDSALYYLKKLENTRIDNAEYLREIGDFYFVLQNYQKAINYYTTALTINPSPDLYNNLAYAYEIEKKFDEAKKYFLKAIYMNPNHLASLANMADLYYGFATYDSAIIYLKRLLPLVKSTEKVYNLIGTSFLNSRHYDSAAVYFNYVLSKDSLNKNTYINAGHSYFLNEKYLQAIPFYEKALKLDSVYTNAIPRLAYCYLIQKKYDKSILLYQRAIATDSVIDNSANYYYNIACAMSLQSKKEEALNYLENSLKAGYADIKHLEEDEDLNNIRALAAFKKIIETYFKKEEIEKYPKLFGSK